MVSAGVLNCFEVLTNGIVTLIDSNLRNLDLTWNWLFGNYSIFRHKAIEQYMVIFHKVWGYLNKIDHIYSNFYRRHIHNYHRYQSDIAMISLLIYEARIMILLLYCYAICILKQNNSNSWMLLAINIYDYGIICNVPCENVNCKTNVIDQIIINIFFIHGLELDGIKKMKNVKV